MDRVRKAAEVSDGHHGFVMSHSYAGGTGSGLTGLIMRSLHDDFIKPEVVQVPIYPSPQTSNTVVEPYNTVMHLDQSLLFSGLAVNMDNEAIGDICRRQLMHLQPTFTVMNQVIALITSSMFSPIRYQNTQVASLAEISTNLVPFPRIHFPVVRHVPLLHTSKLTHHKMNVERLTNDVLSYKEQTVKCDLMQGKFMACMLTYRGLVSLRLVNKAVNNLKSMAHMDFVEWCPTGFK
ncbi:unnamed protein product, partial [Protopolystoma xenopodis]